MGVDLRVTQSCIRLSLKIILDYPLQTWKKLQAALADILLEITLFWGHYESNIQYFWLRMEEEELKMKNWGLRMENEGLELKIDVAGFWIEDGQPIFEDSIMPHQHSIHIFLFILCCESRYFEDIVKF